MKLFSVFAILGLALVVFSQDIDIDVTSQDPSETPGSESPVTVDQDPPTVSTEDPAAPTEEAAITEEPALTEETDVTEGPAATEEPTTIPLEFAAVTTSGRPKKLNCTDVECDQAVLSECEKPVLFIGDSCCPVCPMSDVCAEVECGEGEVCSEKDGEAVCCTDKTSEHKGKKDLNKRLRDRFGFEKCSTRKEARAGVNRGPCRNGSCDEDEVCMAVMNRAFCCPRPDAGLPPCEGAAAVQTRFLGHCHIPGAAPPTRSPGDCHCQLSYQGQGRRPRPYRPRPTPKASDEEEEEEHEGADKDEPSDKDELTERTHEVEDSEGDRKKRHIGDHSRFHGRSFGGHGSRRRSSGYSSRRRSMGYSRRRFSGPRPTMRCRCGYSMVHRLMESLNKARHQIRNCRPAPPQ